MGEPLPGVNVPENWIEQTVVVLSRGVGETTLPLGGTPLVAELYSGELRAVNSFGVSLMLRTRREKEEGTFYQGGDTFFAWNSVVRISLASP